MAESWIPAIRGRTSMIDPGAKQTEPAAGSPPPIRLVLAFRDAVDASPPRPELGGEAALVESLMIAAVSSLEALMRFRDLWFAAAYGDLGQPLPCDERVVFDGYDSWLDGAQPLMERLRRLEDADYDSPSAAAFRARYQQARASWNDAHNRRNLEQHALKANDLAELASRLGPRQEAYD
jgi:hypothetical protein